MLIHPQFDPVAFSLGPLAVRWYGLMYMAGFFCFWLLGKRRSADSWRGVSGEDLENLLFYGIFGVILGGRLGYCLFYQPAFYLSHPMQILHVWEGGMSAHGGLLGVIAVMILCTSFRSGRFRTSLRRWCRLGSCSGESATSSTANSGGVRLIRRFRGR